ncbi:hypothetical protein J31TS4_44400 [Paenibacillus sp. J31TS4]|uniref:cupredoxin domain-containing protein n=1 Tax=Paenibacillus sp. J31TS4 TaxID=2807195 RepID=UPI001B053079|nr:cupredoxin domain-containing protein [Paenibacillus sp. J31TS4]GIP41160.1 hypothetical protein J31TS4_44400 [Paenibacillus sp. J31TS4]
MFKAVVLSKKKLVLAAALLVSAVVGGVVYRYAGTDPAVQTASAPVRTIHMVTGEFKTTGTDGKEIEAYRWDPGTIYMKKGETVQISIYGVNGASHPFYIEGTSIKGEVKKGKETLIPFKADKEGIYRLICMTHPDIAHSGPMIAYIVVD